MATELELLGFEKVDWSKPLPDIENKADKQTPENKDPQGGTQTENIKPPANEKKDGETTKDVKPPETEKTETEAKPKQDDKAKPEEWKLNLEFFNKSFGTQFGSEDALKQAIQESSKVSELESRLSEFEQLKSDLEYYKDGLNPLDYFASEDDFRIQQLKKQNPNKDVGIAYRAFTSDLSKLDDVDVLVMYELFNNPNLKGGEAGAREIVESEYGIEHEEGFALTRIQENKIRKAANFARSEFKELKDSIKLPERLNLQADREAELAKKAQRDVELKVKWDATINEMFNRMDKVPVYDTDADGNKVELLNYVMDDNSKAILKQEIANHVISNGMDLTRENISQAGQIVYSKFILDNLANIIKSYSNDLLAKQQLAIDTDIHNAEKVTTETKPDSESDKEKAEFHAFAVGGGGFKKKPLF